MAKLGAGKELGMGFYKTVVTDTRSSVGMYTRIELLPINYLVIQ